ncbi:Gag [Moniliophthora roreri MCA 2997]|uniref:Gag n=1 Tax=Moniliophthora roreri (strain MCA 2997) TaxID=1381753 RepID=V2WLH7_MONRO|nr:Gag [Moniliophthora roreri MCA 2997]
MKSLNKQKVQSVEIDTLTKAMEELHLNQAKAIQDAIREAMGTVSMLNVTASLSNSSNATNATQGSAQPRANTGRCLMCRKASGIDLNHPLGILKCPETIKLLEVGDVKQVINEQGQSRIVMPNGAELPWVAPGASGGVAEVIHLQKQQVS